MADLLDKIALPRPAESRDLVAATYRFLFVAAQLATILMTWRLWQMRESPPLLPALALPQIGFGPLLIVSLEVVLIAPRLGVALHMALLFVAMLLDQTRIQPEFISLAILMLGTLPYPAAKLIVRAHLIALWFFAGFHKLVCADYYSGSVSFLFQAAVGDDQAQALRYYAVGGLVAVFEMSLAVLALIPRTRRLCACLACALHLGILLNLMFRLNWNYAVWPWNAALALAGFAFIWPWTSSARTDWLQCRWPIRGVALCLLVSPLAYYFGWLDPYLAHCIYANNTPRATIIRANGKIERIDTYPTLNVPFPPAHRLFEAYFESVGRPGDKLEISDPRWCAAVYGCSKREIEKPRK